MRRKTSGRDSSANSVTYPSGGRTWPEMTNRNDGQDYTQKVVAECPGDVKFMLHEGVEPLTSGFCQDQVFVYSRFVEFTKLWGVTDGWTYITRANAPASPRTTTVRETEDSFSVFSFRKKFDGLRFAPSVLRVFSWFGVS